MRSADGYGGPVVHWWQNCLQYTGAGLDWRYEGIILGYLNLYERTHQRNWLIKAVRAGDDLVRGQLAVGNYRNSCFELNPYPGGTPHEAAADIGLLALAECLRHENDPAADKYLSAARRNIDNYYIGVLWDSEASLFRDNPKTLSFVPNKAATLTEALFRLAASSGDERYITQYALPTLQTLLDCQVNGAVYQNMLRGKIVHKYFPYYVARCVPALVLGYTYTAEERYAEAARNALAWVLNQRTPDGGFIQVVYEGGRRNVYQQWVAAIGDILSIARQSHAVGFDVDVTNSHLWLLRGLQPSGGCATARGFGAQISQRAPGTLPDFRDILPVCGWVDKAFRYLTGLVQEDAAINGETLVPFETTCLLRGKVRRYREDNTSITLTGPQNSVIYHWRKGESWARVCGAELLWK